VIPNSATSEPALIVHVAGGGGAAERQLVVRDAGEAAQAGLHRREVGELDGADALDVQVLQHRLAAVRPAAQRRDAAEAFVESALLAEDAQAEHAAREDQGVVADAEDGLGAGVGGGHGREEERAGGAREAETGAAARHVCRWRGVPGAAAGARDVPGKTSGNAPPRHLPAARGSRRGSGAPTPGPDAPGAAARPARTGPTSRFAPAPAPTPRPIPTRSCLDSSPARPGPP
jgi:hypothetical protein